MVYRVSQLTPFFFNNPVIPIPKIILYFLKKYSEEIQTSVSLFLYCILFCNVFENVELSESKFKRVVLQLFNFAEVLKTKGR